MTSWNQNKVDMATSEYRLELVRINTAMHITAAPDCYVAAGGC